MNKLLLKKIFDILISENVPLGKGLGVATNLLLYLATQAKIPKDSFTLFLVKLNSAYIDLNNHFDKDE